MITRVAQLVTPKQVAQAINVSESSLKRWCDRGLLKTVRTPGGHRRVAVADVVDFLRKSGQELVRPALLGLPSTTGEGTLAIARARDQMRTALLAGDVELCRRIAFDLHLAGKSVSTICDSVLAESMREIGDRWSCDQAEVYQERRASTICLRLLSELRSSIPAPAEKQPLAIGGTPECDPYSLPTTMAETVLRQNGWRAQSLGSRLPFSTLVAAIRDLRPNLFWLSVSHLENADRFLAEYRAFYEEVRSEVAVVVGGRALTEPLRRQMEYSAFGDNMQHLEAFAQTLKRSFRTERRKENSAAGREVKPSRTGKSF
jgi:MerR family transcriptional regulator, light-induced transcriptional regulator